MGDLAMSMRPSLEKGDKDCKARKMDMDAWLELYPVSTH